MRLNFEEVGQYACRSQSALHHTRLEQTPHRLGRVSVLGDHCLQRTFLAQRSRVLCPQAVQTTLGLDLLLALRLKRLAQLNNFSRQSRHPLRHRFEFQRQLTALSTKRFHL